MGDHVFSMGYRGATKMDLFSACKAAEARELVLLDLIRDLAHPKSGEDYARLVQEADQVLRETLENIHSVSRPQSE